MPATLLRIANRFEVHKLADDAHLLGQGGMGSVYRGLDTLTETPVAIKVLKADRLSDDSMVQRFVREGQALRQLNHPNIVKMLDAIEQDGVNYLIMEYVAGGSLRHLMDKTPRVETRKVVQIGLDIADALTRAHRLNILHRDIKPDNVLLAEDGTPRLTDFGMARVGGAPHLTQDGAVLGTLPYLAPEAFNGELMDERADIWSFGVMLYEMLAGQRPFSYAEIGNLIAAILTQHPPRLEDLRPDLPSALVDLVDRMLAKDVRVRIPSARVVGAELEAILRGDHWVNIASILSTPVPSIISDADSSAPLPTPRFNVVPSRRASVPNNLPIPPTPFVGRERELRELGQLLNDPHQRLLSLVGPGGVGKTRIALALAQQHIDLFEDGVYCVALASVHSESQAVIAVAEALNVSFTSTCEPRQELFDYLREKRLLLLLDNFENIIDSANLLADLLQTASQLKVVVTSRERLRLRGEQVYEVGTFEQPSPSLNLEELMTLPAVQLFQHSARRLQPDFRVDVNNAQAVAAIIYAVEGLPLAIELAATWLESLPVEAIAHEIERSIDFLETDLRDVPERQRSIRAVFAHAWGRLSADEQAVFARLTLFQGGFERDAAEKAGKASLRLLNNLINKSLIQRDAKGRYSVQKLLRQYVAEQIDPQQQAQGLTDHAVYYAAWLKRLEGMFNTSQERHALDQAEYEMANLRLAWQTSVQQGLWEAAASMASPLWFYAVGRSMYREGVALFDDLIQALERQQLAKAAFYWRVVTMRHLMSGRMGDYEESLRVATSAYNFFRQDPQAQVDQTRALNVIAHAQMMLGRVAEARDTSARAVEILGDMLDPVLWYMAMANYGYAEYLLGNYDLAHILYESILHTADNVPCSPIVLAYAENNLGEIVREQGDYERAKRLFQAAYDEFSAQHNRRGMALSLNNLGGIIFFSGDYDRAEKMYQKAYQLHREIGDRPGMGYSLSALGNIAMSKNEVGKARECYEQALALRRALQDQRGVADSLLDLGRCALNAEDYLHAERLLQEVIALAGQIGYHEGLGNAHALLALIMTLSDRIGQALPHIEEAQRIAHDLQNLVLMMKADTALAQYWVRTGHFEGAERLAHKSLARTQALQAPTFAAFNLVMLAQIYTARGEYRRALEVVAGVILYRGFIKAIQYLALNVLDELRQTLPAEEVDAALKPSRTVSLPGVIARVSAWKP
ncbi:MAG: protein kinase [Anaerolineae bacterium]|nr:protein kinase [Anaerolineae bacterium]MDW8172134.1 protein kinase [Anaerolineae bacterium]